MAWKTYSRAALLLISCSLFAQPAIHYEVSFANAVHHEANISVTFGDLGEQALTINMSRSSPGRYALHEFAKNVYNLTAEDGRGRELTVERLSPHQWRVAGHDGTVNLNYTLFANRGDGTYSQVDESHAHLNMPATFVYAPDFADREVQVKFHPREDLRWKIATQLVPLGDNTYSAPGLHYFMDSPVEISDHRVKSFEALSGGKTQTIRFVLHQSEGYAGFEDYMEQVERIVAQETAIFGELPDFDYGTYTFLACYIPQASGDGMEHRNSTVCTRTTPLDKGGLKGNIGTVAHEFLHAWNVERLRPDSLEPFDYQEANMSGELWFAEGFTSYYTDLVLCRAGIISVPEYLTDIEGTLDYVINSPAREFHGPVHMSMQAPFVDAATSIDPTNEENTFISYYSYGHVLGIALDLMLREQFDDKNLDGFMRLAWEARGKAEIPYTLDDLQQLLGKYVGKDFADSFFGEFIFRGELPDYRALFAAFGIACGPKDASRPYVGASLRAMDNSWAVSSNPLRGSPLYEAGLQQGDRIIALDGKLTRADAGGNPLAGFRPGQQVEVKYQRHGQVNAAQLTLAPHPGIGLSLIQNPSKESLRRQQAWLQAKQD